MKYKYIIIAITALLIVQLAAAASPALPNIIDQIGKLGGAGTQIWDSYERYAYFIDAILFFIMFIGLAQYALGEKFKDNKTVPIVIGVILSIGMGIFAKTTGFTFGKMWWFVGLIFFLILGTAIFKLIQGWGANGWLSFSVAYIIIFVLIQSTAPKLLEQIAKLDWLGSILSLAFIFAIIGFIYGIIKLIKGISSGSTPLFNASNAESRREKEQKKLLNKEQEAAEKISAVGSDVQQMDSKIGQLEQLEDQLENKDRMNREEQLKTLQQLEQVIQGTWKIQKAIQKIHENITKPEYQQYIANIQQYATTLKAYTDRLKALLDNLQRVITTSKNETDQQLANIDNEFKKDVERLIIDNSTLLKDVQKDLENVKGTEIYPELLAQYNNLNQEINGAVRADQTVNASEKIIISNLTSIRKMDTENLKDINSALTMLSRDPLQVVAITTTLNKTFNPFKLGLIRDQTLSEIEKTISRIRSSVEGIISSEQSNAERLKQKRDRVAQMINVENNIISKYQVFIQKINDETIRLYTEEEKLFDKSAIKLAEVAKKLIVPDLGMDPGLKAMDLHDGSMEIIQIESDINTTLTGKSKRIMELKAELKKYTAAMRRLIANFEGKGKDTGKINQNNQKLLNKFLDNITTAIQERRNLIIKNARKK